MKRSNDYDEVTEDIPLNDGYFQIGTVHGVKHLSSPRKIDKIFWGLAIVISLIFLVYFISINQNQSITAEIDEKIPLYRIPFPAITICPETKAKKSVVNFTDAYHNLIYNLSEDQYSDEYLSYIEALTQVCDPHLFSNVKVKNETPTQGEEFIDILRKIAVPKSEMILFCKYRNEILDCDDLFTESIIDDGICYTFNMMNYQKAFTKSKEYSWNVDDGYSTSELETYPQRAFSGSDFGFNVVLSMSTVDFDFLCRGPTQGYKVLVHSPDEHPQTANGFVRISLNTDLVISTRAKMTNDEVNAGVKCHSSATKKLEFFEGYSQRNCRFECLSNLVLEKCGCVKFSMVHKNGTNICNQHQTSCVVQAVYSFFITENFQSQFICDCKPACNNLNYDIKATTANFDFKKVFEAFQQDLDGEFPKSVMSRLQLFFTDDHFVHKTIKRVEKEDRTIAERISQIGGLMAFFIGASILSIIEIFYFLLKKIIPY